MFWEYPGGKDTGNEPVWRGPQSYCFTLSKRNRKQRPLKSIHVCDETVGLILEHLLHEKDKTDALLKTHLFALKGCSDPWGGGVGGGTKTERPEKD